MSQDAQKGWEARALRAWHLAVLRFAVTLENADRLAVLAIAAEIDRLGPSHRGRPAFGFFRRTTAELCAAILEPNELSSAALRQHLARIDDDRLKRVFAAAIEADPEGMKTVDRTLLKAKLATSASQGIATCPEAKAGAWLFQWKFTVVP